LGTLAKQECFLNQEHGRVSDCPRFSMDIKGLGLSARPFLCVFRVEFFRHWTSQPCIY